MASCSLVGETASGATDTTVLTAGATGAGMQVKFAPLSSTGPSTADEKDAVTGLLLKGSVIESVVDVLAFFRERSTSADTAAATATAEVT